MPPYFNLCLLIVVAVLSLSRNALARSNTSLASMCKKAYYKFSTYFWAFSKGPGQLAAHMRSLARAFAQRVKVSIANTLNACVKLSWCLVCQCKQWMNCKGCSDVCSHLKMSPMSNAPFCEILVFITCVSSIDSNQPVHLCSLARVCTAWTQCIYRICKFM